MYTVAVTAGSLADVKGTCRDVGCQFLLMGCLLVLVLNGGNTFAEMVLERG